MSYESRRRLRVAFLLGAWIYGLILWVYIVVDSFIFPAYQYLAISKFVPIPQNVIADLAFPLSFVCFVAWAYTKGEPSS